MVGIAYVTDVEWYSLGLRDFSAHLDSEGYQNNEVLVKVDIQRIR